LITLVAIFLVQALAVAAAWVLRLREERIRGSLPYLVAVAVGVLLATALLHLLPESVEALGNRRGLWLALGLTLLVLFALERVFTALTGVAAEQLPVPGVAHHGPDGAGPGCAHLHTSGRKLGPVNLVAASSLHSFVDGTAIATAFAVNTRLGLLTAVAVALHEVPHRMGDVAVLLHLGVKPGRAMRYAVLVALPSLVGAAVVLALGYGHAGLFRWLLPVSAGSFLYIAGANLLPEIPAPRDLRMAVLQLVALCFGGGLVFLVTGIHAG
jgi:zinc and cadmium transporter